jgi:hypothetical protein
MAGYKQQVIDDDAASLWTFDGDAFDSGSRKLIVPDGDPLFILDEIDSLNPAILHNDNETYLGYRLGMPSLVSFEQTDQHSISFGFYGKQPDHPNQWAKAFLEVPNTISYSFPNNGNFSLEFIFYRQYSTDEGLTGYQGYERPIISKSGVFNVKFVHPYSSSAYLYVSHPGGNIGTTIPLGNFKGTYDLIGNIIHFALTWEVKNTGGGHYQGIARVYINSYLMSEQIYEYLDTFPNTNLNTPIYIAGNTGSNRQYDWHTSNFQMDQIAIYSRTLTEDEIANHFSKIMPYDEMIKAEFVNSYWPFDDNDSNVYFKIDPDVGSLYGDYVGTRGTHFQRGLDGPENLLGAKAAGFTDGGMAQFISTNSSSTYVSRTINSEYTYEFWMAVSALKRGVILAAQELAYPFDGLLVQLNMKDHQEVIGSLQFTESDNSRVFNSKFLDDNGSRLNYSDGNWHHVVLLRRANNQVEYWIDGELHDSSIESTKTVGQPGQLVLMNSMPGHLYCNGSICKLAYYPYALLQHQIRSHYSYSITYRIRGIVTLLGVPYQAVLRFYKSSTGALIQELTSDPNTGEYEAVFYNNSNVDIFVFSPFDLSVRYRTYGPVTPSEFIDLPINI